jgi:hypothetical protein
VTGRELTLISQSKVSEAESEPVTRGTLYKFALLFYSKTGHVATFGITLSQRIQLRSDLSGWKDNRSGYLRKLFQTLWIKNSGVTPETIRYIFLSKQNYFWYLHSWLPEFRALEKVGIFVIRDHGWMLLIKIEI